MFILCWVVFSFNWIVRIYEIRGGVRFKSDTLKLTDLMQILIALMPSMGPKWFWTVQIILVEYQSFWAGSIHFGWIQIILGRSKSKKLVQKSLIWTWPKWFGPNQNDLGTIKTIWTVQNHFGLIEGQDIRVSWLFESLDIPKTWYTNSHISSCMCGSLIH